MGKIYQILIGCMAAFLPLYIQISSVDLGRMSKSTASLLLIPLIAMFMGDNLRKLETYFKLIFAYFIFHMLIWSFEPALASGVYQNVCIASFGFFLISYIEKAESNASFIINSIAIGALIQATIVLFQLFDIELYPKLVQLFYGNLNIHDVSSAPTGSLGNQNILASYLAIAFPMFFKGRKLYALPLIALAIYVSKSEMAYLAAAFSAAYYFFANTEKKEMALYATFPALFFTACYFFKDRISGRWQIWEATLSGNDFWSSIFGKSSSWLYVQVIDVKGAGRILHEHNDFISLFNIFGFIGLFLIGIVFFQVIKNQAKNKIMAASLFAGFVNMHGHFPMQIAPTAFLIILALGHCLMKDKNGINLDR